MYVYICIYVYIYMFIYIYLQMHICLSTYIYINTYRYTYKYLYILVLHELSSSNTHPTDKSQTDSHGKPEHSCNICFPSQHICSSFPRERIWILSSQVCVGRRPGEHQITRHLIFF